MRLRLPDASASRPPPWASIVAAATGIAGVGLRGGINGDTDGVSESAGSRHGVPARRTAG